MMVIQSKAEKRLDIYPIDKHLSCSCNDRIGQCIKAVYVKLLASPINFVT